MSVVRALSPRAAFRLRLPAVLLAAGLAGSGAVAGIDERAEAAWRQAVALAGAPQDDLSRPEVIFEPEASGIPLQVLAEYVPFAHEVRIYRAGRAPLHTLLVHEFLHAIYHELHAPSLTLSGLQQEDPSESWVQARMESAR